MRLLRRIRFDYQCDQLIFVGDLINRGPNSLEVLRFVRSLGSQARVTLGNHDISFLAYALGCYHGRDSDFPELLAAHDSQELVQWLRNQPLLIHDKRLNIVVVHAGIPPRWSLEQAKKQAKKAEKVLRGDNVKKYLERAYRKNRCRWQPDFNKYDKFRYRLNGFSRMRYCDAAGEPDFDDKCPPGLQSSELEPWFEVRKKHQDDGGVRLVFGHWAALGYYVNPSVICLDSGCVWGNALTAISLENRRIKRYWVASYSKTY
ncbi:MAG: hypothetical protein CSA47_01840 [Gammaproteobacteria bacterium]|nr:MAG: hypothetical protein CSA47_01840 [Gammaproteobacteria bacterium]